MGLYNSLFGTNPATAYLLKILNVTPEQTGRFRDAYVADGHIIVYTRNGGGNREFQETGITFLRAHPNYIKDWDDDFDSTYAYFEFSVPEGSFGEDTNEPMSYTEFIQELEKLQVENEWLPPNKRWEHLFKDLNERKETPDTKRAIEVGTEIGKAIAKAVKDDEKK